MAGKERFHGGHFPKSIVLQAVFWYLRYSLSYRDIEELMEERGVELDHATIQRWVVKYTPILEVEFRKRKKAVGTSWRMDETYIKVKGKWHYLYRAVDKEGKTIDFLLTTNQRLSGIRQLRCILRTIPFCKQVIWPKNSQTFRFVGRFPSGKRNNTINTSLL